MHTNEFNRRVHHQNPVIICGDATEMMILNGGDYIW